MGWKVTFCECLRLLDLNFCGTTHRCSRLFRSTRQLPCYSIPAPPAALAEHIPDETYKKSQAYGKDKTRFSLFKQAYSQVLNAAFIAGGAYKWAWTLTGGWMAKMGFAGDRVVSRP